MIANIYWLKGKWPFINQLPCCNFCISLIIFIWLHSQLQRFFTIFYLRFRNFVLFFLIFFRFLSNRLTIVSSQCNPFSKLTSLKYQSCPCLNIIDKMTIEAIQIHITFSSSSPSRHACNVIGGFLLYLPFPYTTGTVPQSTTRRCHFQSNASTPLLIVLQVKSASHANSKPAVAMESTRE